MAPEQIHSLKYSKETDVWAFGCVLYEIYACEGALVRVCLRVFMCLSRAVERRGASGGSAQHVVGTAFDIARGAQQRTCCAWLLTPTLRCCRTGLSICAK